MRLARLALAITLLTAASAVGQSNYRVIVDHCDAQKCATIQGMGLSGPCQQNVFVLVLVPDPANVDSVKVVMAFTSGGYAKGKVAYSEVSAHGTATVSFPLNDIKVTSVTVTPLGVSGNATTVNYN